LNFKKIKKDLKREEKKKGKKETKQRMKECKEKIDCCNSEKLIEILEEIEIDPCLTKKEKNRLEIRVLNKPFLPNNVIEKFKNGKHLNPDMRWRLYEAENSDNGEEDEELKLS